MHQDTRYGLIGLLIIIVIVIVVYYNYPSNVLSNNIQNINIISNVNDTIKDIVKDGPITLTAQEIAKHNKADNCWMIISGNVYVLTGYLYSHSGGAQAIIPSCGGDGTQIFLNKGGNGSHSSRAVQFLNSMLLGKVGVAIGASDLQKTQINIQQTTNNLSRGESEDD